MSGSFSAPSYRQLTSREAFRAILYAPLDFTKSTWAHVSPEARDCVQRLLARDADARPSAIEALQHPWLTHTADKWTLSYEDGNQPVVSYSSEVVGPRVGLDSGAPSDVVWNGALGGEDETLAGSVKG